MYIAKKDSFENWRSLLMPHKLRCKKFCRLQSLQIFLYIFIGCNTVTIYIFFQKFQTANFFFSIGCPPTDHRQGARVWGGAAVQSDPAPLDVPYPGGPGASPSGQGHRPHPVQTWRPGAALRPQDPGRHRAAANRRGLLRQSGGERNHL